MENDAMLVESISHDFIVIAKLKRRQRKGFGSPGSKRIISVGA
jgi:hypothetical protein